MIKTDKNSRLKRHEKIMYFDDLFVSSKGISLQKACERYEQDTGDTMSERNFAYIIKELQNLGSDVSVKKQAEGWLYSASRRVFATRNRNLLNQDDLMQLRESAHIIKQFKDLNHLYWLDQIALKIETQTGLSVAENEACIQFERLPAPRDVRWLRPLYDAIRQQKVVEIYYTPFQDDESDQNRFKNTLDTEGIARLFVHPYLLKERHAHWHLFGWIEELGSFTNLALDRIRHVQVVTIHKPFRKKMGTAFVTDYFKDILGITRFQNDRPVETFRLRLSPIMAAFVRNRPIHTSQSENIADFSQNTEGCVFSFHLRWNWEWQAKVLSWGANVEVIEPQWFRTQISDAHQAAAALYR